MSSPSNSSSRPPYITFSRLSLPAHIPKGQSQEHRPIVSSLSSGTNAHLTASIDDAALPRKATSNEHIIRLDRPGNATDNFSEKIGKLDKRSTTLKKESLG
jgi:hypothetical protein